MFLYYLNVNIKLLTLMDSVTLIIVLFSTGKKNKKTWLIGNFRKLTSYTGW